MGSSGSMARGELCGLTAGRPCRAVRPGREFYELEEGELPSQGAQQAQGAQAQGLVPAFWGADNQRPQKLVALTRRNPLLSAAMEFKSNLLSGHGVVPVRRVDRGGGRWADVPAWDCEPVVRFLEDNDVNGWFQEEAIDRVVLGNVFPELVLNRGRDRVVALRHREALFSRWARADTQGCIAQHLYASQWQGGQASGDLEVTPVLPRYETARALRCYMGLERDPAGLYREQRGVFRYIVPIHFPTPGRSYYARPWWESVVESGWYDYVAALPRYKSMLLHNGAILRYHVRLMPQFWEGLYQQYGATSEQEKNAVKNRWYAELNKFLSDSENTGRAFVSQRWQMGDQAQDLVSIEPLKSEERGGELIADVEETSNILAYAMGIHPSLIGASPGKNKSINGTEARELFIMKQALMKPDRLQLLRPLYIVKAVNRWPQEIHFTVANLELTTLDQNSGMKKSIGQEACDDL